jgi:hypothetical protein
MDQCIRMWGTISSTQECEQLAIGITKEALPRPIHPYEVVVLEDLEAVLKRFELITLVHQNSYSSS